MKKIIMINTVILILFSLPIEKDIAKASTSQVPVLRAEQEGNNVKLDWAVEMLDEDILYKTGFEEGDLLPNLNYGNSVDYLPEHRKYGGQSFTTEEKFSGLRSLKVNNSYANANYVTNDINGNWYVLDDYSWSDFNHQRFYMPNGTNLSLTFRAKTTGSGIIYFRGVGGKAEYGEPIDVTFLQDVKVGDRTVKVSDISLFKSYVDQNKRYYIALSKGEYTYGFVISYDEKNSTITLNTGFRGTFKKGENVLRHVNRNPVDFSQREVKQEDGWTLFNVNTKVLNYPDYNTLTKGFYLAIMTKTPDIVYIDDMKVGYATRTQLFRNGTKIYDGYLSEYEDDGLEDNAKPNKVTNYHFTKENEKFFVKFDEPNDVGTDYNYKVRAISNNGGATYDSDITTVTITSGVKGFLYKIDNNPNTVPNGDIHSFDEQIAIPITANENDYLHVQVVDHAGNKSDVTHIPLKNIINDELTLAVPTSVTGEAEMILGEKKEKVELSFDTNVFVENYYQKPNEGWKLNLSATKLTKLEDNHTLPEGTISIKPINEVRSVGNAIGEPEIKVTNKTVIDDEKITLLHAKSGTGIGKYEIVLPENAIEIVIDPSIAKVGTYKSTLVWELTYAP